MDEYPKYLPSANVIVQNRDEEEAVLNIDRPPSEQVGDKVAIVGLLVHSAGGDTYGIKGYKPVKEKK